VTTTSSADADTLGYVGSKPGVRDSDAWFTPARYVEAARTALGGDIDLDPFTCAHAQAVVQALRIFTEADDAFEQEWAPSVPVRVWMNPPYTGKLIARAVNRLIDEWESGRVSASVVLVNNATETRWFQRALGSASAVCFTDHRIAFWNEDGKARSGNTRGQAFLYFGDDPDAFVSSFAGFGRVLLLPQ
jgi:ParB family chromosome partitioning protein